MMRFFTSDLRRNLTKIICLSIGLALGLLMVAKVYFEHTYDSFLPDSHRLYLVAESVEQSGEYHEYTQTPGGIAPGVKRYSPSVEGATHSTILTGDGQLATADGRSFDIDGVCMADSCWFDVIATPVLAGNPHDILAAQDMIMIPRSLAEKIGDDCIGMSVIFPHFSNDYSVTIGGIYEDYPLNSSFPNWVFLSLPTIAKFSYDGRENWMGNDRYKSYVKLMKGASAEDIDPDLRKMLAENVDKDVLDNLHYEMHLRPLVGNYSSREGVKTMMTVLTLLSLIILLSASLNYLLIVIGQMGSRSKEMAIRKCYGTSSGRIFLRVMGESIFFLLLSLAFALLIAFSFSDLSKKLLDYSTYELFSTGRVWAVEGGICLVILLITGVVPAWLYCRTPVAEAFRNRPSHRKAWKLSLLFVQFFATGVMICLLALVYRQYCNMARADMGFEYDNVAIASLHSRDRAGASTLIGELKKLGSVKGAASGYQELTSKASGNNIWMNGDTEKTVNVADLYWADPELFQVLGIRMLQGDGFREWADSTSGQVVVEERMVKVLQEKFDVKGDNIIGQRFSITEHGNWDPFSEYEIVGVVSNMRRGGFDKEGADTRAGVFFPGFYPAYLYVRFNTLTPEALSEAQGVVDKVFPDKATLLTPYREQIGSFLQPVKNFGTSVMIAGIAMLVISLIGLAGYTSDEVNRRAKEIAIRKVTGYTARQVVGIFCLDALKVAVPALLLGGAVALLIGRRWLSMFTDRVSLSPAVMAGCLVVLLIIIGCVVAANSFRIARSNPVGHLRDE